MPPRKPKASAAGATAPNQCRVKKVAKPKRPVNPPLDELLELRANDPNMPEAVRALARAFLAGERTDSKECDAIIARRDARVRAQQEQQEKTS